LKLFYKITSWNIITFYPNSRNWKSHKHIYRQITLVHPITHKHKHSDSRTSIYLLAHICTTYTNTRNLYTNTTQTHLLHIASNTQRKEKTENPHTPHHPTWQTERQTYMTTSRAPSNIENPRKVSNAPLCAILRTPLRGEYDAPSNDCLSSLSPHNRPAGLKQFCEGCLLWKKCSQLLFNPANSRVQIRFNENVRRIIYIIEYCTYWQTSG